MRQCRIKIFATTHNSPPLQTKIEAAPPVRNKTHPDNFTLYPSQLPVRQRSCENQGIGDRNDDQNAEMQQMHFRGEIRVISKGTKRIDGGMNENTGNQTAAAVKDRDQQKAHRNVKDDLAQIADQIHAVTVEQIDDMSDAESHAGNDDGRFHIVLCKGCEQQPPEDHFLQESNAEHTHDPYNRKSQFVFLI